MPKHVLGIELGSQSLTFVQLSGTTKSYEITAVGYQPLSHYEDPAIPFAPHQHTLRELVDNHQLQSDSIIVALPAAQAVLRNVTVPFTEPRRIRQILKYTLDESIPFEPDEIVADFQTLPSAATAATPLLAAAVQQNTIAQVLTLFHDVGLEPTMIDLDVFALASAAVWGTSSLATHTLLLDVQPARTLLTVLHGAVPVYARSWAYGWDHPDVPLQTFATRLSTHVQHTIYAYENVSETTYEADGILLSGMPHGELSSLATVLQDHLQTPTACWNMTAKTWGNIGDGILLSDEQPRYAVAFGAAVRGLYRQATGIDLRRERFALHRNLQEFRGHLIALSGLLLLVLSLGLGKLYVGNHVKTQRHAYLEQEITRVFRATLPDTRVQQPVFQVREKIADMQNRLRAFGGLGGAQLSVLQILREISARIPSSLTLNVETLTMTTATVDMSGTTGSYDNVVKLKDALEASPAIETVKINTTKATTTNQVTFQLTITTAKQLEATS